VDDVMLTPCEAVSLRYMHDILTGDFVTIGVVVYSRAHAFIGARVTRTFDRVKGAFPEADDVHLRRIGVAIQEQCEEWRRRYAEELPLGAPETFAALLPSLLPVEDAALQFSPITTGVTSDPQRTLDELFARFVGIRTEKPERESRSETDVWRAFTRRLSDPSVVRRLKPFRVTVPHYDFEFRHAWKNGTWHAVQPLSFDLLDAQDIKEKAVAWSGKLNMLRPRDRELEVKMLVALPPNNRPRHVQDAARDAVAILTDTAREHAEVVREDQGDRIARQIVEDLAQHEP
jgi:hypothetical protein